MLAWQGGTTGQNWLYGWRNFLSPDNPFVPWLLLFDLVLLLVYLYSVYWVYRDALHRYNRGAPWAAAAALLPLGGWLFYLLYRVSPLVQLDRIEAETFDEAEHVWTDYDQYRQNRGSELFRELASVWRAPEGEGYSPYVRLSRLRELRRRLTPAEKVARRQERIATREAATKARQERSTAAKARKAEAQRLRKDRRTLSAAHGFKVTMSESRQARVRKQLQLVEELKKLPREVQLLEDLIYEMDYAAALKAAQDSLALAEEMGDAQGRITYAHYIERIQRMLAEDTAEVQA
jgi:hypothetical protein